MIAAFTHRAAIRPRERLLPSRTRSARAAGVRDSVVDDDIRIDYVQHAMSGWLHLARLLRDPTYGTASPAPRPAAVDGGS